MDTPERLSREAFCARFTTHMVKLVSARAGNAELAKNYAEGIAPTYFDCQAREDPDISPEAWVEEDMSYWEE